MRSAMLLKASAAMLLSLPLVGCVTTSISNDVPACDKLIPASLLAPVDGADPSDTGTHPGTEFEKAQPWQEAWLLTQVALAKANERPPAVDHIYRECLKLHRDALKRSNRGFFGRLF